MATEYISRDAMHKANRYEWDGVCGDYDGHQIFIDNETMIDSIPAADVRPVVRGKWEKHEDFDTYGGGRFVEWVCSECDKRLRGDWVTRNSHIEETQTENYCPNCGADMREDGTDG